jgi:superkiller protein 3
VAALFVPASSPSAAGPAEMERSRQLFNRGRAAFERQDYEAAAASLEAAGRLDPQNPRLQHYLGRALLESHHFKQAEAALRLAVRLTPGDLAARLDLARVLRQQVRFDEALAEFSAVAAADPGNSEAFFYSGQIHYQRGEYEKARAALGKAVALAPASASALPRYQLGATLLRLGDLAGAERELRRSLELQPDYARALYALAEAREQSGDAKEAAALRARFDTLQRQEQERDEKGARYRHHERLGLLHSDRGEWPQAVSEFETAVSLEPRNARAYTYLGIALSNAGRIDPALAAFRKAIDLDPGQALALTELGRMLAMRGELQQARGYLEKAVAANPNLIEAHEFLANVYEDLGRSEDSRRERQTMETLKRSGTGESVYD